jgi:hypothetical protein
MSDSYGGDQNLRVGDTERTAAIDELNAHWRAGRLDPGEHEARTTRAHAAVTRGDLQALFADLPPTDVPQAPWVAQPPVAQPGAVSADRPLVRPDSALGRYRGRLMALVPLVAVVLFFTTHSWLWFLAVPIAGVVLNGPKAK